MHELRYPDDYAVAAEQRRRAGVQRVRPLLQTSRCQQAVDDEKGRYPDEKEETEEATVIVVVFVQRYVQRGQRPTASTASATAAASALVHGHRPIGYYYVHSCFSIVNIIILWYEKPYHCLYVSLLFYLHFLSIFLTV